jgi:serine/threonine protein kinase
MDIFCLAVFCLAEALAIAIPWAFVFFCSRGVTPTNLLFPLQPCLSVVRRWTVQIGVSVTRTQLVPLRSTSTERRIQFLDSSDKRPKYDPEEVTMAFPSSSSQNTENNNSNRPAPSYVTPNIVVEGVADEVADGVGPQFHGSGITPQQDVANAHAWAFSDDSSLASGGDDQYINPDWPEARKLLPDPFQCLIHLTLDGKALEQTADLWVNWKDDRAYSDAYNRIENTAMRLLKASPDLGSRQPYLKHGSCKTISNQRVELPRPLEKREEWTEILALLTHEYASHSAEGFHLEISRDYSAMQINPASDDSSYYAQMQEEIHSKMKENFKGNRFIPRIDLINIITSGNIRRTIRTAQSFHSLKSELNGALDEENFILQVQRYSPKLFAICVFYDIDMKCLKKLLDNGITDKQLPLEQMHCPDPRDPRLSRQFHMLLEHQGGFLAHEFKNVGDHNVIHPRVVVPVLFSPGIDRIGGGGFSNVYKARIDPDHLVFAKARHSISGFSVQMMLTRRQDKKQVFAIKEFREFSTIENDFRREQTMLQELRRYPHYHIVVHLASWIQDGKYYLVFPYADCNLRQYMSRLPEPTLTKSFVLWILRQFRGLTDAIRNVHNLNESGQQSGRTLTAPKVSGQQQGYHHDIKPENILFFEGKGADDARLKIADFGLGKVHSLRSGSSRDSRDNRIPVSRHTRPTNAFPTYEAPDGYLNGYISRPADMWSLGCVFLELLVWIFVPTEPDAGDFPRARMGRPFAHIPQIIDDAFWFLSDDSKHAFLRKGVVEWISRVENLSSNKRAFQRILECVKELLEPRSAGRLTAVDLMNRVDALWKQAKSDLEEKPDLYLERDVTFPSEGMLPSKTRPPSPFIGPVGPPGNIPNFSPTPLPGAPVFPDAFNGQSPYPIVASPMEDSLLQVPGRPRRSSYGMPSSPNVLSGTHSRALSISSAISFSSDATKGSANGSMDDYAEQRK